MTSPSQMISGGFNLLAQQEQAQNKLKADQEASQQKAEIAFGDKMMQTMLDTGNTEGANQILGIMKEFFPKFKGVSDIDRVAVKLGKSVNVREITGTDGITEFGDRLTADQISNLKSKPDSIFEIDTDSNGNIVGVDTKSASGVDIEVGKFLLGRKDKLVKDASFIRGSKKLSAANNVRRLFEQAKLGNQNALNLMKTQVPRLAGEVGNLAKTEQETSIGGVSLKRKLDDLISKLSIGQLSPDGMKDLAGILDVFEGSAKSDINELIGREVSAVTASGIPGVTRDRIGKVLNVFLEEETSKVNVEDFSSLTDEEIDAELAKLEG